jgi:hypothetical protein
MTIPAPTSTHPSTTEVDGVRPGVSSTSEFPPTTSTMPARTVRRARSLANRLLERGGLFHQLSMPSMCCTE